MKAARGPLLGVEDHDRAAVGLTYVYPVVSRRAGGVSIGVNLNPNNACNWRCVYCQVPDLRRGSPPPVDLGRLRKELDAFLWEVLQGGFLEERVPEACRRICDVAVSGNGEPTACRIFDEVVEVILDCLRRNGLLDRIKIVLITNGSYVHRPEVRKGLVGMAAHGGEVWFKVDAATEEDIARINGVKLRPERLLRQLRVAAALCPVWIQTCVFEWDGEAPRETWIRSYLDLLSCLFRNGIPISGILLYGVARPSMQPEAYRISPASPAWFRTLRTRIEAVGFEVRVCP